MGHSNNDRDAWNCFWITIVLANYPSKFLSWIFELGRDPLVYFFKFMNIPMWISNLLVDGVYQTVTWIVSVMLPPMAIFFPMFTLLEDVGVLPRIAFNLDNFLEKLVLQESKHLLCVWDLVAMLLEL